MTKQIRIYLSIEQVVIHDFKRIYSQEWIEDIETLNDLYTRLKSLADTVMPQGSFVDGQGRVHPPMTFVIEKDKRDK